MYPKIVASPGEVITFRDELKFLAAKLKGEEDVPVKTGTYGLKSIISDALIGGSLT